MGHYSRSLNTFLIMIPGKGTRDLKINFAVLIQSSIFITMTKPRIALVIGIICISIFPILVKLKLSPPIISAFYRMAIAAAVLVPYTLISGKFRIPSLKMFWLTVVCGGIFALDVA